MISTIIKGILISLAISIDAFAVAMVEGLHINSKHRTKPLLQLAFFFSITNVAIFAIGYLLGAPIATVFDSVDHWVAFGLLILVALHMLYDVLIGNKKNKDKEATSSTQPEALPTKGNRKFDIRRIFLLALAIGIDAFAVGLSYSLSGEPLWLHSIIFFAITVIVCFVGGWLGGLVKPRYISIAEIIGAVVLALIGVNIVIEHTSPDRESAVAPIEIQSTQTHSNDIMVQ